MPAVIFLLTFAVYLSGLSGSIPSYRDAGDLIASVSTLGIAHPPGYPTYVVLGHFIWRLIPWGNAAYRVTLVSALCAGASAVFLFLSMRTVLRESAAGPLVRESLAALLTLLYAVTPAVLALARVTEMYTCAALFATCILFLLVDERPRRPLAAFLLGLGLGVHPTLLFLTPLLWLQRTDADPFGIQEGRTALFFFLLGLSIFLFLPVRSTVHPLLNWGDPSHWRNFWRAVTRADYGGLKLHPQQSELHWSIHGVLSHLGSWHQTMAREWSWVGLFGGLAVWAWLVTRSKSQIGRLLLLCLFATGPAFFVLSNLPLAEVTSDPILQPYLLLSHIVWALGLAYGVAQGIKPAWMLAGTLVTLGLVAPAAFSQEAGWRHHFYAYDYGRNLMRSLPRGAVLYDPDDPTAFSVRALQIIEHRRGDIILLSFFRTRWGYEQLVRDYPELLPPVPINNSADLQRYLWTYSVQRHPFYAELPQKFGKIPYHSEGIVYRAEPLPRGAATESERRRAEELLEIYPTRGIMKTTAHREFFVSHLIGYYAAARNNLALEFANRRQWDKAIAYYQSALTIDPVLAAAFNNWGIAAYEQKNYALAKVLYEKAIQLEPGNSSSRANLQLALEAENHEKLPGK